MKWLLKFNEKRPLFFVLILLVAWMILVSLVAVLVGYLVNKPVADPLVQAFGTLVATLLLLFGAYRIGWFNKIGITSFGSPLSWLATLGVAIYVLIVDFYAYFGEISFQFDLLFERKAVPILLQGLRTGFVEEIVFRGIILYSLVRVWGKKKGGVVFAIFVQAFLFAFPHVLQMFAGAPPMSALSNVLATLVFGLWSGMLVLIVGSVWPAIFLHAVSNSFTLIKGLSSPWITPYYLGYLRAVLFELPLVLFGLWVVLKLNRKESPEAFSKTIEKEKT